MLSGEYRRRSPVTPDAPAFALSPALDPCPEEGAMGGVGQNALASASADVVRKFYWNL